MIIIIQFLLLHHLNIEICHKFFFYSTSGTLLFIIISRNDMLSTGGNRRRRARGSCYVNKPAYGFFIAGSSHKSMNGVYVRDNAPDFDPENKDGLISSLSVIKIQSCC